MAVPTLDDIGLGNLNLKEITQDASVLSRPAGEFGNSQDLEMKWAIKASHHAETYFNLISSLEPKLLRLTKHDDLLYKRFRAEFPDLQIATLVEDSLKSDEGKQKWRPFCEEFKEVVDDYNFATLIRTDCTMDYSEKNSFVVPKVQFLVLEIARNREGLNSGLRKSS